MVYGESNGAFAFDLDSQGHSDFDFLSRKRAALSHTLMYY